MMLQFVVNFMLRIVLVKNDILLKNDMSPLMDDIDVLSGLHYFSRRFDIVCNHLIPIYEIVFPLQCIYIGSIIFLRLVDII